MSQDLLEKPSVSPISSRESTKLALVLALVFFLGKLLLSSLIPLIGDEAYYWVWAQNLQMSYFDHPPFVAWLFKISEFGSSILGPRWVSLLMASITIFFWTQISTELIFDRFKLKIWILVLMVSPMIGFGSLLVTPDVPLVFFWTLATWLGLRIIDQHRLIHYAGLGVVLGLGFCSKYHIVLWPLALIIFLWRERMWRVLSPRGLLTTFIFGFIFSLPVILWNFQNDFQSFRFQVDHGLNQGPWEWQWTLNYLLGQALILAPIVFSKTFYRLTDGMLPKDKIHFYLGWTPLVFFLISSFRGPVEMNWPLMSFAHLGFLFFLRSPSPLKWGQIYGAAWVPLSVLIIFCSVLPQFNFLHGKLNEPKKYSENMARIETYRPLFASTYQMASSIWYFSRVPTYKLKGESRYDFFDEQPESVPKTDHFYYLKEDYQSLPIEFMKKGYRVKLVSRPFSQHSLYEVHTR